MSQNVALVGPMHSGKSSIARTLEDEHGYVRIALADAVKDDAVSLLNLWIEAYAPRKPWVTREIIEQQKGAFRPFLQWLGTEWGRLFVGPESIWVDRFLKKANGVAEFGKSVVCDDCRFPNEAEALRAAGFLIVRVWRPEEQRQTSLAKAGAVSGYSATHPSETELANIKHDISVDNETPDAPRVIAAVLAAWPNLETTLP